MRYDAILIDADDTLYDFGTAQRNAIGQVLLAIGIVDPAAPEIYSNINHQCWMDFEQGKITQDQLKIRRFKELIAFYQLDADAAHAAELFADALSQQGCMIEGAMDVVKRIAEKLPVVIVTNGIARIQHGRIDCSGLGPLISGLIISEEVGCAKPDPRMIQGALDALGGIDRSRALMVGDSLTSDMRCAMNAGVDACWYNPHHKPMPQDMSILYEIDDIRALPEIALS